jgi:hypothetical protein
VIISRKSESGRTAIEATLVPGQPANVWWATREAPTPGTGPALDFHELEAGVLTLKLRATGQRSYQFLITMEKSITGSKADGAFLNLKGAQRETGEVLVEGAGTIQLSAIAGGSLKRMDVKEANAYLRSLAHFPPQAAFRYHRQANVAPTLALEWVRFPDSSVLAAVAEHAVVTTLVTSEGKTLTEVRLTLKNQAQPFLKVALPQGAGILSAEVAGETVKPVQGADGNRVPLLRPGFRTTDAYDVSFVFMHSGAPFAKKGGSELSLPQMDVPINLLDCTRPIENNLTLDVGAAAENVEVTASTSDLRESERARRDAKKQAQLAPQAASMNVINLQRRVAGVLPVALDVPRAGTSFRFVRPLVLNEETKVTFAYKSK